MLVAASVLTACDKPLPKVTVQSGSKSALVSAQPSCVTQGTCGLDEKQAKRFTAVAGSTILVDVPLEVANKGWLVKALVADSTGKIVALDGGGSVSTNDHSVRLQVPAKAELDYLLQVVPVVPKSNSRTWVISVRTTQ